MSGLDFKVGDFRMGRFRNVERESGRRRSRNDDHEADGPEESISDEVSVSFPPCTSIYLAI